MKNLFINSMLVLGVLMSTQAFAQTTIVQEPLLDKIKKTNTIKLGYRNNSIPLSYVEGASKPKGYAVEICEAMIEQIRKDFNLPELKIEYVEINDNDNFNKIKNGVADLECADSINNASNRELVSFTVPHLITGVKILTKSDKKITKLIDLKNKRIAVAPISATFELVKKYNDTIKLNITFVESNNVAKSINMVETSEVDAFLANDILLYTHIAQSLNPEGLNVVGEFLSIEPLAIAFRKNDPNFKTYANKFMINLMKTGKIMVIYDKWFNQNLTVINNKTMNLPPSALFLDLLRYPTEIVGN